MRSCRFPCVAFWGIAGTLCGAPGCFDDSVPPGAVILCRDDSECPSKMLCDQVRHECFDADGDRRAPALTQVELTPAYARTGTVVTPTPRT